ncbi:MAG TPA: hypothetical protein VGG84_15235 [Gemmatimonadaceae bacterium]|jgi:hypothetical protein
MAVEIDAEAFVARARRDPVFCNAVHPDRPDVFCRRLHHTDGPHGAFVDAISALEEW